MLADCFHQTAPLSSLSASALSSRNLLYKDPVLPSLHSSWTGISILSLGTKPSSFTKSWYGQHWICYLVLQMDTLAIIIIIISQIQSCKMASFTQSYICCKVSTLQSFTLYYSAKWQVWHTAIWHKGQFEFDCGNDHALWMALTKPLAVTYVWTHTQQNRTYVCASVCATVGKHLWCLAACSSVVSDESPTRRWELFGVATSGDQWLDPV